jgi:hypothetical protein
MKNSWLDVSHESDEVAIAATDAYSFGRGRFTGADGFTGSTIDEGAGNGSTTVTGSTTGAATVSGDKTVGAGAASTTGELDGKSSTSPFASELGDPSTAKIGVVS